MSAQVYAHVQCDEYHGHPRILWLQRSLLASMSSRSQVVLPLHRHRHLHPNPAVLRGILNREAHAKLAVVLSRWVSRRSKCILCHRHLHLHRKTHATNLHREGQLRDLGHRKNLVLLLSTIVYQGLRLRILLSSSGGTRYYRDVVVRDHHDIWHRLQAFC